MKTIGCFVSSHGFGHATRVCAILEAINRRTEVEAHIYCNVDESIFAQGRFRYRYHKLVSDIGFMQSDVFRVDIKKTLTQLEDSIPYKSSLVNSLVNDSSNHSFLLCDISALGIAVAAKAQIPSVLIENFTWDWLYTPYALLYPDLEYYCQFLSKMYDAADYHIQTKPLCNPAKADLLCDPIFREVREEPGAVRERFNCGSRKIVLITLGGLGFTPQFFNELKKLKDYFFLVAGQEKEGRPSENVQLLHRVSNHYHPDLINCADITVFKGGYSTLAECYQVGKPTICIQREGFAESKVLETYALEHMQSHIISQEDFTSGKWLDILPLIKSKPQKVPPQNGADTAASLLVALL